MNATHDHLETTTCDSCHVEDKSVVLHHLGVPVLALCRRCDPASFERGARADINRWLNGDDNAVR